MLGCKWNPVLLKDQRPQHWLIQYLRVYYTVCRSGATAAMQSRVPSHEILSSQYRRIMCPSGLSWMTLQHEHQVLNLMIEGVSPKITWEDLSSLTCPRYLSPRYLSPDSGISCLRHKLLEDKELNLKLSASNRIPTLQCRLNIYFYNQIIWLWS